MDAFSGLALTVVLVAAGLLALYTTIRAAVRDGIRDARDRERGDAERS